MRIALVCPYAWDAAGGVQVHVGELDEVLRARGHEVAVLTPALVAAPGVNVVGRAHEIAYRGTVAPIAPNPVGIRRVRRILEVFEPEVVHVHEPETPSTSMWATIAARAPIVATFHSYLDRSWALRLAAPLLRPVLRRPRALIAVSASAATALRRAFPELSPTLVPNGVDVAAFTTGAPDPDLPQGRVIVWTHRLDPQKGFGVMLDAFRSIVEHGDDVQLVVAGDGPDRGLVKRLPAAVRDRVRMLGAVAHDRVPGLMRGAALVVAPATGQESFGLVLVEAMAAGVPVVATDIPGYREVATHGRDAVLVPPADPAALAAAVLQVLGDADLARSLIEGGRARAAGFDWSDVAGRIETIYEEAVTAGPSVR